MKRLLHNFLEDRAKKFGRRIRVGLIGLGSTNRAALRLLGGMDAVGEITLRSRDKVKDPPSGARLIAGEPFRDIYEDILIPSPSVRREDLSLPVGTEMITDYRLLFEERPKDLFLVSGSDGKSTTTAIASLLLSPRFPQLFTGGNIGVPLFDASLDSDAFLLEMSSFTLRYDKPSGFGRAVLTNVTPNHLDWHASLGEYEECKLGMIRGADEPILNLSDGVSMRAAEDIRAFALVSDALSHKDIIKRYSAEHTVTVRDGAVRLDGEAIVPISEVRRNERHNLQNLASAVALSIGYAEKELVAEAARGFEGLGERCERFFKDGIGYVSSSIDTTPERTRTTLEGLGIPVNIILGGRGKRLPLEPLREPLIKYARRIAIYGEASREMLEFIDSDTELRRIPHRSFFTLKDAVDYAREDTRPGDTVLLSPAATSYGEFSNYLERGSFFKDCVTKNTQKI